MKSEGPELDTGLDPSLQIRFYVISEAYTNKGERTLRVQVPNSHILTQILCYNYYCPNPKYLIIGYLDPKP